MPSLLGHSMRRYIRKDQIIHNDSRLELQETNWKNSFTAMARSLLVMTEELRVLPLASRKIAMCYHPHRRWRTTISINTKRLIEISDQITPWRERLVITNTMFLTIITMFSKIRVTAFMISWKRRRISVHPSHRPHIRLLLALEAQEEALVVEMGQPTLTAELAVKFKRNKAIPAYQRDQDLKNLILE